MFSVNSQEDISFVLVLAQRLACKHLVGLINLSSVLVGERTCGDLVCSGTVSFGSRHVVVVHVSHVHLSLLLLGPLFFSGRGLGTSHNRFRICMRWAVTTKVRALTNQSQCSIQWTHTMTHQRDLEVIDSRGSLRI